MDAGDARRLGAEGKAAIVECADHEAPREAERHVRRDERADLEARLDEHERQVLVDARRLVADQADAEAAADAEVGHRGRVHVIEEPAAERDVGVVLAAAVGEAEEAAEVELAEVVVRRHAAEQPVELHFAADAERALGATRRRGARAERDETKTQDDCEVLLHGGEHTCTPPTFKRTTARIARALNHVRLRGCWRPS